MPTRTDERLAAGTGLAATLVVGVAGLVGVWTDGPGADLAGAWWVAYALFVVAFLLDSDLVPTGGAPEPRRRPAALRSEVLALVQVVAALAVWAAGPQAGWTSVLFVVSAASVAFVHHRSVVVAVVAVQTTAIAVGTAYLGRPATDVILTAVVYASFQGFAGLVVLSARREAESRAALAAAHAELRATAALLAASSRDAERLRISRDLHDVVGHQLTALALELEVASHRVTGDGAEHVARARRVAKDLLRDVRATVDGLRQDVHGLRSALDDVVADSPGLGVTVEVDERVPVEQGDAVVVVRCVQELVTNARRHAGARTLAVRVVVDDSGVVLEARDDGHGVRRLELGHGLTGMVERVEDRGGVIAFDPGVGRGFGVTARIPAP